MTGLEVSANRVVGLARGGGRETDFTWTLISFEERRQVWSRASAPQEFSQLDCVSAAELEQELGC